MTNDERLDLMLDEIYKELNKDNVRIIISRMKSDKEFKMDFLAFVTVLCFKCPDILELIIYQVRTFTFVEHLKKILGDKKGE